MPLNILLVEDSLDLCQSWAELLELDGHRVHYFLSAREALQNRNVLDLADVVVSDYYLPDQNGLDLLRNLRELRPKLPAVLLTGAKDPALKEHVARLENAVLLHKPVRAEELESAFANILTLSLTRL